MNSMADNSRHRDVEKHGTRNAKRGTQKSAVGSPQSVVKDQQSPAPGSVPDRRSFSEGGTPALWYAIYTKARNEKKLHERLREQEIESYLPLVKTLRQWSDRKKWVEVPLLSSYVFVKVPQYRLREVIQVEGAAKYISFEGKPAAIPDNQIDNLRLLVNGEADIEVTGERLSPGDPVEVTTGSLRGLTGELIKINNRNKVVVRIDRLDVNLVVSIQKAFLKKLR